MYFLSQELFFPPVDTASPEGLLAIGGDLSPERLQLAYASGIFPWFDHQEPILWWSPDPRMVLFPEELKVSKSMKQVLKKQPFTVTYNTCFNEVIENCARITRPEQDGTWITQNMQAAYLKLDELGLAMSVEVWKDEELVGGLYGINLKDQKVFCGESMFSKVSNASKYGFIYLVEQLKKESYQLIDCQIYTEHLASLGAREISRTAFLSYL